MPKQPAFPSMLHANKEKQTQHERLSLDNGCIFAMNVAAVIP